MSIPGPTIVRSALNDINDGLVVPILPPKTAVSDFSAMPSIVESFAYRMKSEQVVDDCGNGVAYFGFIDVGDVTKVWLFTPDLIPF